MFLLTRIFDLFPHIFICVLFIVVSLNIGLLITKFLKRKSPAFIHIPTSIIFGYIVLSYYYFLVGMLQQFKEPFLTIIPLIFGVMAAFLNRTILLNYFALSREHYKTILILCTAFLFIILFKDFPDIGFDSNWYHLSQPFFYLKNGGIFHVGGYIFPSGYPQFTEMLFIPLLHLGNSITTSLFSLFNYFLLGLVVFKITFVYTKKFLYGLAAALLILTTPIIFTYAGFAYVDILQGLCLLLSLYWLQNYLDTHDFKNIIISAILLLPVASIKYSGGLLCIPLAGYLLVSDIKFKEKIKALFVLTVIPIAGLIPWLIRNKLEVGNFLDPMGTVKISHYGSDAPNYFAYLTSINWLATPEILTSGDPLDYFIFICVAAVLIFSIINKNWKYVVFVLLSLVILRSMPPGNDYRYYIPYIPILIILFVTTVSKVDNRFVKLAFHLILIFFLSSQYVNLILKSVPLISYAFGNKTTNDFKEKFFVKEPFIFYDPTGRVKAEVGTQKLIVKGVDLIYPTLEDFDAEDYSFAQLDRQKIYSFRTLRSEMLQNDYKYILVNRGTLQDHFALWFIENGDDKVDTYFDLVVHERTPDGKEWFLYKPK